MSLSYVDYVLTIFLNIFTLLPLEISAEKTKLMTNNTQGISTEVKVNGHRLETVKSFRYLGSNITDEGSKPEILARIAQTTAALTRLKPLWNDRNITVSSKIRLMRSLVMSIFLYASETWTLSADLQKRIQTMEMRCFRKILRISYKDHVTNEAVRNKIKQAIGPYDDPLTTVKKRKLKWYGHVSRSSGLAKTILQGTVRGGDEEVDRRRGGKTTSKSEQEWSSLTPRGLSRTGKRGESWLESHQWCPNDPYGLWESEEEKTISRAYVSLLLHSDVTSNYCEINKGRRCPSRLRW